MSEPDELQQVHTSVRIADLIGLGSVAHQNLDITSECAMSYLSTQKDLRKCV